MASLDKLFRRIDRNEEKYVQRLEETVAIQSVSAWPEARGECRRMAEWTKTEFEKLGVTCTLEEVGKQKLPDGSRIELPPVVLGTLGNDRKKKTLLIYGHLDVMPAEKADGWDTEPFVLTEKDGKLYGRGSTDDKGPVLGWLNCLEAMQEVRMDIPVNLKFMFEAMEESGSLGLEELIEDKQDTFMKGIDYVCVSDNYWLQTTKPCLTYGLRGIAYFTVEIKSAKRDLHSGIYGGTMYEGMSDLVAILDSLVDVKGKIVIPGVYDAVAEVTDEELARTNTVEFDMDEFKAETGTTSLPYEDKVDLLLARWRQPSLSIHGIEGAFSGPGTKTVIPGTVIGKFSIRTVPNQDLNDLKKMVLRHVKQVHRARGTPNELKVRMTTSGDYWITDFTHPNFTAGEKATEIVYGVKPDLTREGGSIPVILTIAKYAKTNVMLLPVGQSDDGAHSQNEKMSTYNYMQGVKLFAAYMQEIAKLP